MKTTGNPILDQRIRLARLAQVHSELDATLKRLTRHDHPLGAIQPVDNECTPEDLGFDADDTAELRRLVLGDAA